MDLDQIMERLAVCRVYATAVSTIHTNEREEERAARDAAPAWAFEPRHVAEGFDWADAGR